MGRRLPFEANPSTHPALSLSLLVAWIAAIVAVVAGLCSSRSKKSSARKSPQPSTSPSPLPYKASEEPQTETTLPLPLPPALQKPVEMAQQAQEHVLPSAPKPKETTSTNALPNEQGASPSSNAMSTSSRQKLMVSISMKLPEALSKIRSVREVQRRRLRSEADKPGESLWTKTIILGERCRVPSGDDDAINYDERGNRIPAYPSRMPSSLPATRSNSYIDPNAIPTQNS